jgi:uncharacterized protein YjdB
MSRKIPSKPFGANAEAKVPETSKINTSPVSAKRVKAAAKANLQVTTLPVSAKRVKAAAKANPQVTTLPVSATQEKAVGQGPVQVFSQPVSESTYKAGFQFIVLLFIIALGGLAGYYGVPVVSQAINPTLVTRVDFNDTVLNYQVGDTGRLGVSVQGEYSRSDLKWVSSDYSILDVDQGGNVFAKAPGTVIIQAFVGNGSIKDTIVINVSLPSE